MSTTPPEPSEEELRAAYEAEMAQIRVEHILLEHVVTLINLGMRRTGLVPGTESERDPVQVEFAIEGVRALLPVVERAAPEQVNPIRQALSQLQLGYVRIGGAPPSPDAAQRQPTEPPGPATPSGPAPATPSGPSPGGPQKSGEPGPAVKSGRLWVPGQ